MPVRTANEAPMPSIRVTPSAPTELMWLLHNLTAKHELTGPFQPQERLRKDLGPEIAGFWPDGQGHYSTDVVVLAHLIGNLEDLDVDPFFERLSAGVPDAPIPSLLSEGRDREVVVERIGALRQDPSMRRRYLALLRKVWGEAAKDWNGVGRRAVAAEAVEWERSLNAGTPYMRLLGLVRLWSGHPEFDEMADAAVEQRKLVLTPCWFGGACYFLEMDGMVCVGRGIRSDDHSYRKIAHEVSSNIRALADPTRLAILLFLARRSASVTEIAQQFDLSQPTVSAHVQMLREAGLLDEKTAGRSAKLSASQEGLRRLFSNAEASLVRLFRE